MSEELAGVFISFSFILDNIQYLSLLYGYPIHRSVYDGMMDDIGYLYDIYYNKYMIGISIFHIWYISYMILIPNKNRRE